MKRVMQVAKMERTEPRFLMHSRTGDWRCRVSAGAGIEEERGRREERCQSPQYTLLEGSFERQQQSQRLFYEEDGCVCSVSKMKFCKKQINILFSAFFSLLPPVEGCRPQGRAPSEPDIPKCLVPNSLDN